MFEWDEAKSEATRRHRGFGFEIAHDFDWQTAHVVEDMRKDYGESRYLAFGKANGFWYCLAFTFRGENIRIISARRMHEKERKRYGLS